MGSVDAFSDRLVKNYDLPVEYVEAVKTDSKNPKRNRLRARGNYGTTRSGFDALRVETMVKDR